MTEQEAINNFKIVNKRWLEDENMYSNTMEIEIDDEFIKTIDKGIEALEKQIPKEPRFYNCNYYCPACDDLVGCHDTIMKWDNKFCKDCGQAIKWE